MLTNRHSHHQLKHHLHDSLRKERELNNRISVLMAEKQRRLKEIEKRVTLIHEEQEIRLEKTFRREEVERSFQEERRNEQINGQLAKGLRRDLSLGLSAKQQLLLQTKRSWYLQAKRQSQSNQARITTFRRKQLQNNQISSKRIKLMQLHAKENVRHYWKERGEIIQQDRTKESEKNSQLFEHSLHNISILEQKEQRLLREIKETLQIQTHYTPIIEPEQNQHQQASTLPTSFS